MIKLYYITLRVLSYGCETISFKLRDVHWLRVFQNRVLRNIFGQKERSNRSVEKFA
jgi:hypothetical protein